MAEPKSAERPKVLNNPREGANAAHYTILLYNTHMSPTKPILVIGATGAQGIAVIDKLLAPGPDGSPSPYSVRALTRDPNGRRARELADKGVEVVKGEKSFHSTSTKQLIPSRIGAFDDLPTVLDALQGVWGVWNNTDGFTVGEMKEVYAGIRIFELAKQVKTVRHYVWSNLDYSFKVSAQCMIVSQAS